MQRLIRGAIHAGMLAAGAPAVRRFARAAADPERAQVERLRRFLAANADTAYGRAQSYARIDSLRAFQDRVPIVSGAELGPWIARIAAGEPRVLSRAPVIALERTSGTVGDELVPYTAEFLADLAAATGPWFADLARAYPEMVGRRQYWAISPAGRPAERTTGGLPIGLSDDTAYFGAATRWALGRLMAVPGDLARERSMVAWRADTIRRLLSCSDLGLISVWSPSFCALLLDAIARDLDAHLESLPQERAAAIRRRVEAQGRLTARALWPNLALVSCWADGPSAELIPALARKLGDVPIQGKGLLATQGVVSFPLQECRDTGCVVAATSHVLEFIDLNRPNARPRLCHELQVGGDYSPILTTGAGFARYHLKDVVRCTGHVRRLPLVRFVGKLDRVSDVAGEKLHAAQVEAALARAADRARVRLAFALLAPAGRAPTRYLLFAETTADRDRLEALADHLDEALCQSQHYRTCRRLGQLARVDVVLVRHGMQTFTRVLRERGLRLGDIKPARLDPDTTWTRIFAAGRTSLGDATRAPARARNPDKTGHTARDRVR